MTYNIILFIAIIISGGQRGTFRFDFTTRMQKRVAVERENKQANVNHKSELRGKWRKR